jgi:hypothetical protein
MKTENPHPPRIIVILSTPGIIVGLGGGGRAVGNMFERAIQRALHDHGVYEKATAIAWENRAIGVFHVTHQHKALLAIRQELESLGLLNCSQIAWLDYREDVWRVWHPAGERDSIAITQQSLGAWMEMTAKAIARMKGE